MEQTIFTSLSILLVSYLVGSISFSRIAMRLLNKGARVEEVKIEGSQTNGEEIPLIMGGNAVSVRHGSPAGCLVSFLDMLKGFAPTLAVRLLFPEQPYYLIAAVGAVAGHNWPVFFRFRGGTGFSPMLGSLLVIDWLSIPVAVLASLLIGLILLRNMGLVFLVLVLTLIPWMWFRFGDFYHPAFALLLLVFLLITWIPTIRIALRRMKDGTGFNDMQSIMESMPMGRGMNRILDFLHLKPLSSSSAAKNKQETS